MTDKLYLRDAEIRSFEASVVAVDGERVELDRTAFYATSGGQPHDTGHLVWTTGAASVIDVLTVNTILWHTLAGPIPAVGTAVIGEIDDDRRRKMMRTHTAMHILCGVMWKHWRRVVTGGNMEPLAGRMDFEMPEFPDGFVAEVETLCNSEIAADRPIEVSFLAREQAVLDRDLIRTKVSLVPESVPEIRVVDIVGLDKQADGGTHVSSTNQVGGMKITKTESKGKGFKRIRFVVTDG